MGRKGGWAVLVKEDKDRAGARAGPRTRALDAAVTCPLGVSSQTQTILVSPGATQLSWLRGSRGVAHILRVAVVGSFEVVLVCLMESSHPQTSCNPRLGFCPPVALPACCCFCTLVPSHLHRCVLPVSAFFISLPLTQPSHSHLLFSLGRIDNPPLYPESSNLRLDY